MKCMCHVALIGTSEWVLSSPAKPKQLKRKRPFVMDGPKRGLYAEFKPSAPLAVHFGITFVKFIMDLIVETSACTVRETSTCTIGVR